jgi:flagellin
MALNVISNFAANVAHRSLSMSDSDTTNSLAKLSAGTRVLSAKDDAASLAIGSRLRAEVASLKTASVNASQASSMLQIADGAMSTIGDILVRIKALSVQASSGQYSATERGVLNSEFVELRNEIDRITADTEFNSTILLDGSAGALSFKVGTGVTADDSISFTIGTTDSTTLAINLDDLTTAANADTAIGTVSAAIDTMNQNRSDIGAAQNRLSFAANNLATNIENQEAARSTLLDLDVAAEMSVFTSKQILVQTGVAMLAQANQLPQNLLRLFQ